MDPVKLGAFLQKLRKEWNLTQEQLAEQLGVTNRTVSRWETGATLPPIDILLTLSDFYNIPIGELLDGERHADSAQNERTEILVKAADYGAATERNRQQRTVAATVLGLLFCALIATVASALLENVTYGNILHYVILAVFTVYSLLLLAHLKHSSSSACWKVLIGGFISIILSYLLIILLFFSLSGYRNLGLGGLFGAVGLIITIFAGTAIVVEKTGDS